MSAQEPTAVRKPMASVSPGEFKFNRPKNADGVDTLIKQHGIRIIDLRLSRVSSGPFGQRLPRVRGDA